MRIRHAKLQASIGKLIAAAVRQHVTEVAPQVITARLRTVIARAEATGFHFTGKTTAIQQLPYLIVYAECRCGYSAYVLPAELKIWADGEVELTILHKDKPVFKVRVMTSGYVAQTMTFQNLLRLRGSKC